MRGYAHSRRGWFALAAAGGLALALVPAAHAGATGPLSTSTTLKATPASSTVGTPVTLKATVKVLGLNGLGVTPKGSVTFTSRNAAGATADLGTAKVSGCLLVPCTATLTTSSIPVGTTSVKAAYSGDALTKPSSGSAAVTVTANTSPGSSSTVTCYSGQPCSSGTVTSTDNTTKLTVVSSPSSGNQTVNASVGSGSLHCQPAGNENPDGDGDDDDGVFVGALATFSSTAPDSTKTITYTGQGTAAGTTGAIMLHQYSEHTAYAGCYGSPTPFQGYTHGVYGAAPFNATDGLYEAQLSNCANHSGQKPCFTNVSSATGDSYVVQTLAGDPKLQG
jgi:hypothetical protein